MMRMRAILPVLFLIATASYAQVDPRLSFGIDRARVVEAIVAQAFPGATVEWSPELTIVYSDGRRESLRVSDLALRREANGFTALVPLEFPEADGALEEQMQRFETPPARTPNELISAKLTPTFAVSQIARGALPDSGVTTRVLSVDFPPETRSAAWPDAQISYAATYVTSEWYGQVEWVARVRTNPIALISRLPLNVGRVEKDQSVRTDDAEVDVIDAQTLSIASATTNQRITTCPAACHIDGKVLLGLWWTRTIAQGVP